MKLTDAEKLKKWNALIKLMNEYRALAGDAIGLADSYAGGESENAKALSDKFDRAEEKNHKLLENW